MQGQFRVGVLGRVIDHYQRILCRVVIGDLRHRVARVNVVQHELIRAVAATGIIARPGADQVIPRAAVQEIDAVVIAAGRCLAPDRVIAVIAIDRIRPAAARGQVIAGATGNRIRPVAARQRIGTVAADQAVAPGPGIQTVIAAVAAQRVVAITAIQAVIAILAMQIVAAIAAGQGVIARLAMQPVDAVAAIQHVIAIAPAQKVVAITARYRIIAAIAAENVIGGTAGQRFGGVRRVYRVVRPRHAAIRRVVGVLVGRRIRLGVGVIQQRPAAGIATGRAVARVVGRVRVVVMRAAVIGRHHRIGDHTGKQRPEQTQKSQHDTPFPPRHRPASFTKVNKDQRQPLGVAA